MSESFNETEVAVGGESSTGFYDRDGYYFRAGVDPRNYWGRHVDENQNQRDITLEEYVGNAIQDFPNLERSVGVRLEALLWKEEHPLREFWRQQMFRVKMWRMPWR